MSAIAVGAAPPAAPSGAGAPSDVLVERKPPPDGLIAESADLGIKWLLAWASDTVAPAAPDDAASDNVDVGVDVGIVRGGQHGARRAAPPPIEAASGGGGRPADDFDRLDVRLAQLLHQQVVTPKETLKTAAARPRRRRRSRCRRRAAAAPVGRRRR